MTTTHPVTGTSERYSLYDRFHQKTQKRPEEKLRSLNICPSLRTAVNSAVAEQFNRELASVRYSLCQMNEPHFKQILRILTNWHNEKLNRRFKQEMEKLCRTQLYIGLHGMLGLQFSETLGNLMLDPAHEVKIQHDIKTHSDSYKSSFVAQSYEITDEDKEKLKLLITGCHDHKQSLSQVFRRFPLTITDIESVCPLQLLGQSSR